jgi:chromosome segregation ATPase
MVVWQAKNNHSTRIIMTTTTEKLIQFFEQIKTLTFWRRVFKWSELRSLSYEAYEEFKSLLMSVAEISNELDTAKNNISIIKNDNDHLNTSNTTLENENKDLKEKINENFKKVSELSSLVAAREEALRQNQNRLNAFEGEAKLTKAKADELSDRIQELSSDLATTDEALRQAENKVKGLEIEVATAKERISGLMQDNSQFRQQNTIFNQTEEERKKSYEKNVASLNAISERVQNERKQEIEQHQQAEIDHLKKMRETWTSHQENVKNAIEMICEKHIIEYVDKVPFKGNPDNVLKICDEFVIFDAKSPASDDLANFPAYVKSQTESVKKYIKEDNVKKEIFLVVPSNTAEVIEQFSYNMADYTVYVVTLDALEPIILSLKKLEEYEFVEQLSPEERDNICRVIGKFAHMTKRRIQIDQFFERQFLEILTKCESELPHDILEKVIEYERSEKLNPAQEKRAKQISSKELESDSQSIRKEAEAKAIAFPISAQQEINKIPLYNDESTDVTKK